MKQIIFQDDKDNNPIDEKELKKHVSDFLDCLIEVTHAFFRLNVSFNRETFYSTLLNGSINFHVNMIKTITKEIKDEKQLEFFNYVIGTLNEKYTEIAQSL